MADKVKARIDGGQEARLAHGEFVIPADVVSHLGNGNSDAGAKKLYQMMDSIRVARTGNKKQGRQINPDSFLPVKPKKMNTGGITDVVPRFNTGGETTAASGELSPWAGPYVGKMLEDTNATANAMVATPENFVWGGDRTAGPSALQTQGLASTSALAVDPAQTAAAGNIKTAADKLGDLSYTPTTQTNQYTATGPYTTGTFTGSDFTGSEVSKYMNPYLEQSLNPQLDAARRQAEITRMTNAGRLVGSGAFGGGRQAVMEAEGDRNLLDNIAGITGRGYDTAFTNARDQFNQSQRQSLDRQKETEASRQFGATQALSNASNTANFGQRAADANTQDNQFGARYGLDALSASMSGYTAAGNAATNATQTAQGIARDQLAAGNLQRGISQDVINGNMARFNETAALPGQAIALRQAGLKGLPISTTTPISPDTSNAEMISSLAGLLGKTDAEIKTLLGIK